MSKSENDHGQSFEDVEEFQKNMMNPGHYIGTGRVPPHVSAPGNAKPLAIAYFFGAGLMLLFTLMVAFSDVRVASSGLVESAITNKIILLLIFSVLAVLFILMGLAYLRKAKAHKQNHRHSRRRK